MFRARFLTLLFVVMLCCSHAIAQQPASVDINSADVATLVKHVKGIGSKKAEAVIQYREANGPFNSVEDLSMVRGIGKKIVDANRHILTATNQ